MPSIILQSCMLLISFGLFAAFVYLWLKQKKIAAQVAYLQYDLKAVHKRARQLLTADLKVAQKLTQIDEQISSINTVKVETDEHDSYYQQALKLVSMGASAEDVMSSCHLTKPEAELLIHLHNVKGQHQKYNNFA